MACDVDSFVRELEYALAEADAYNAKGFADTEQELRRVAEPTNLNAADLSKHASVLTHMPLSPVWLSAQAIEHLLLLIRNVRAGEKLPAVFHDRPAHRPADIAGNNRLARTVDDLREQGVPYTRMVSGPGELKNELEKRGFPRRSCDRELRRFHKEWQQSLDGHVRELEKRYNGGKAIREQVIAERKARDAATLAKLGL